MSPNPVVSWGFKAIKPFDAEQPVGSGTIVHYEPGDEVPASEWGRAEGFMVEAGSIMRYARNVAEVPEQLASIPAASTTPAAAEEVVPEEEPVFTAVEGEPFPQKQAGGWYLLSNGEKVRGKPAAITQQAALDVAAESAESTEGDAVSEGENEVAVAPPVNDDETVPAPVEDETTEGDAETEDEDEVVEDDEA